MSEHAQPLADLEQEFEEVRLDRDAAWEAATIAQNRAAELERQLAVESVERIDAWQVASSARHRVDVFEREQTLNKPIVAAYWAIRTIVANAKDPALALRLIKGEIDKAAGGQRQATETPGDQAMVAAQQQAADIDNIASRAAEDVRRIQESGC